MIVDPNAEIAEGYPANVMPANFGADDLAAKKSNSSSSTWSKTPAGGEKSGKGGKGKPADNEGT